MTQPGKPGTLALVLGTAGGLGYLPLVPGTWASAATLPVGWLLAMAGGMPALVAASLLVFAVGVAASARIVARTGVEDPSIIVIDELAGQLLALTVAPLTWQAYLVAFLAFRVFDILKPWPASWADREIGGGWGVMVDDMFAGAYGAAVVYAFVWQGWI